MRYEISEKAKEDLLNIESFLVDKWDLNVLENFLEKFENVIKMLLENKVIFKRFEDTVFYRFLLTNIILLFTIMGKTFCTFIELFKTIRILNKIINLCSLKNQSNLKN